MSTESDWREAARGIPVWRGAVVVDYPDREHSYPRALCVELPNEEGDFNTAPDPVEYDYEGRSQSAVGREYGVVVDLEDPDTRAAYDRRLALALGMTADEVDFGVLLFWDPRSGAWTYTNGAGRSVRVFGVDDAGIPAQSPHIPCTQHADPLLVRALMWPADKRVKG